MVRNDYLGLASDDFDRKVVQVAKSKGAFFATGLNANTEFSQASRDQVAVKTGNFDAKMRKAGLLSGGRGFQTESGVGKLEPHTSRIAVG
jgi:hypothetical protein